MKDTNFIILADTTCDLNVTLAEKYDVEIIQGHVHYPNGVDERAMLDWKQCSYITEPTSVCFYNELRKDLAGFSTSPPNIQEWYNVFEEHVKAGHSVLSITISAGLSGAFNFASTAKDMILEKYPDAKVEVIDSMRFGSALGLMTVHASILREEGKTFEQVVEYLNENKNRFHQAGWLDDLSFVAKKGRISHAKAFMGTLVGIKPIGEFDKFGLTTIIGKAKGEKNAFKTLIKYIESTIENAEEQVIFIAHSNRLSQAEKYKEMIQEKFNPKAIYINDTFPANGINIGPGLMAAYYIGKPISEELQEEKQLFIDITKTL